MNFKILWAFGVPRVSEGQMGSSLWSLSSDRCGWDNVLMLILMGHFLVEKSQGKKKCRY